jgi:YidC/Oxa1 family membrane protein insertase
LEKRTILAFVLSLLVLIGFQALQAQLNPPARKSAPPGGSAGAGDGLVGPYGGTGTALADPLAADAGAEAGAGDAAGLAATATAAPAEAGAAAPAERPAPVLERTLENDRVAAVFSTEGAALVSWKLKGSRAEASDEPLDLLRPGGAVAPALVLTLENARLATAVWSLDESAPAGALAFVSPPLPGGLVVRKTVHLAEGKPFGLEVALAFENPGKDRAVSYTLYAATAGMTPEDEGREFVPEGQGRNGPLFGVAGVIDGPDVKLKTEMAAKVPPAGAEPRLEYVGNTTFGGVASKYFAAVLLPSRETTSPPTLFLESSNRVLGRGRDPLHVVRAGYRVAPPTGRFHLPSGGRAEHRYLFFAGPKIDDVLASYGDVRLERLLDYTSIIPGAETLSTFFLAILRRFQGATGSWGIAIILLTVLVRAAVHPLSRASIKNMAKMQALAPKIKEIQKKYEGKKTKEAQQKQTLEVMELYKTHNASPVLGCLPTFVQLPVFIGLYNALAYSIELRQSEFLYMHDLSKPDRIFSFGGVNIWFFGGYFNLLPLLMVATMIIQQRMQPTPADPQAQQQAKMMQWMMIFFGALFYHVPAGLVVYFLTSSLLGMAETKWVKNQIAREEAAR